MAPDPVFMARLYGAVVGATLVALGLSVWAGHPDALVRGALFGGAGLFLIAAAFGRASRLPALLGLSALLAAGAFLSGLGWLLLSLRWPAPSTLGLLAAELLAAVVAGGLARRLHRGRAGE